MNRWAAPPGHAVPELKRLLEVAGMDSAQVGLPAARAGIALVELTPVHASLEEAFMEITRDAVEFGPTREAGEDLVCVEGAAR